MTTAATGGRSTIFFELVRGCLAVRVFFGGGGFSILDGFLQRHLRTGGANGTLDDLGERRWSRGTGVLLSGGFRRGLRLGRCPYTAWKEERTRALLQQA